MENLEEYDLVVVGGGPAGYAGAIRAAQLGKRAACVEMERAGGTCLNWGCIPSKALLKSAELYKAIGQAETFGLSVGEVAVDFARVMSRSRDVADRMGKGIEYLFKKNKVDYFVGRGNIPRPGAVEISDGRDAGKSLAAAHTLIATGCRARMLPGLEADGERILTSREALAMTAMPDSIVIVGAGAIGAEFAWFLNAFGCRVTLVEMLPRVLPVEDDEISAVVGKSFKKEGIDIRLDAKVENIAAGKEGVSLDISSDGKTEGLEAECLLVAVGVEANTRGLLGRGVEPDMDRGYLKVDDQYATSVDGLYAAGDIIGPPWLAHVATFEAIQAVNGMFSGHDPERVSVFPGCTYCQPQVASVGMTEREVKEKGIAYRVGKFPFAASGKAVAANHSEGFVKVLVEDDMGELLGAHIVGAEATELIAEYTLAMRAELTVEDIHGTIHPHPTLSEALAEAAAAANGEAIHI
jgi:dihydrolipoamide dehydrogenase